MKIAITAQMRNGLLWEAVKKAGSQSALARQLGVSPSELGRWLNFKSAPGFDGPRFKARRDQLDAKLLEIVGATLDEVFPQEIRSESFQRRHKQIDQTVDLSWEQLIGTGAVPQLPSAPEESVFQREAGEIINSVLETLTPREERVINLRFGLKGRSEHTLEEVAEIFKVSGPRIRQIEAKALRKLRQPQRSTSLKQLYWEPEELRSIRERQEADARARVIQREQEAKVQAEKDKIKGRNRHAAQFLHFLTYEHSPYDILFGDVVERRMFLSGNWTNRLDARASAEGEDFTMSYRPMRRFLSGKERSSDLTNLLRGLNSPVIRRTIEGTRAPLMYRGG